MKIQSNEIGKIVEALSKAQIQFDPIIKDVKAHHHKYAPLDVCYSSTRKALSDNGLIVTQSDALYDGKSILETTLGHISGEFFKSYTDLSELLSNTKGPNPLHSWGSIKTYTRRYSYLLIIGAISQDEDNDGGYIHNQNNGNNKSLVQNKISKDQIDHLNALLSEDPTRIVNILKWAHVNVIEDMSKECYDIAVKLLIKEKDILRLEIPNVKEIYS